MNVLDILLHYREAFMKGLNVTLQLSGIIWITGLTFGLTLGSLSHHWGRSFGRGVRVIAFLLAGIPFLVLLYWMEYPFQQLLGLVIDPFITAAIVMSSINIVGVAEICRGALDDFPAEYVLAAKVCGLSRRQIVVHIQLPLLLRQILPNLLSLQVSMLQMTLFASLIAVPELFRMAQEIDSTIHKPIEIYSALAIFFLAICLPLNGLALWMRMRYTRNISDH
jgi:ABC-type amino acid transport system permease subunit